MRPASRPSRKEPPEKNTKTPVRELPSESPWRFFFSKIFVPLLIGAFIPFFVNQVLVRQEYVKVATGILSQKVADPGEDVPIRKWAADVLEAYSPLKLDKSAKEDLISGKARTGASRSNFLMDQDGQIVTDHKGEPVTE